MNRELTVLLRGLGIEPAESLLIQNTSAINRRGESPDGHGFKLVLLDADGRITHFCKCAGANVEWLQREAEVVEAMRTDTDIGRRVMPVWSGATAAIRVLVSAYAPGGDWRSRVSNQSTGEWTEATSEVLALASRISDRTPTLIPRYADRSPVSIVAEAEPLLTLLGQLGSSERALIDIRSAMARARSLERSVQHGDLWAPNILETPEGWQLTDFELFGDVQVPLYDALHFVRTSMELRHSNGTEFSWLSAMTAEGPDAAAARVLLRDAADRVGLDPAQREAVVLYYVVDIAARVAMRRAPKADQARYAAQVEAFSRTIGHGSLATAIFGG